VPQCQSEKANRADRSRTLSPPPRRLGMRSAACNGCFSKIQPFCQPLGEVHLCLSSASAEHDLSACCVTSRVSCNLNAAPPCVGREGKSLLPRQLQLLSIVANCSMPWSLCFASGQLLLARLHQAPHCTVQVSSWSSWQGRFFGRRAAHTGSAGAFCNSGLYSTP